MPRFLITEPHPTVRTNTYTHAGRGGAGNFFRAPPTTSPSGVPTPITPVTSNSTVASTSSTRFYSGRGGAGNAHSDLERPTISFEDEFSRADIREQMDYGHYVGRGGAGNFASARNPRKEKSKSAAASLRSSNASTMSGSSVKSAFRGAVNGIFSRH
ncbi:hypothetical protein VPNG_06566 [Cytospora leucostoma]|uniref:Uncharacterized protein n=1 Tax=Cytospora leucostoma TaxID=1230097 RepID=A0A423X282_9PEZI|nr:hypothetical protein VPNG_06566 [Cytospora leucostoma]